MPPRSAAARALINARARLVMPSALVIFLAARNTIAASAVMWGSVVSADPHSASALVSSAR